MHKDMIDAILRFISKFHHETDCGTDGLDSHWSECQDLCDELVNYFAELRALEYQLNNQWDTWQGIKNAHKIS